ncbi:hypothetical protein NUSPORA_01451 [Nucleospora cyclopteri]
MEEYISNEGILEVKIYPNSPENKIIKYEGNLIHISISAAPEKNKANEELMKFISKKMGIPRKSVEIVKGVKSRKKYIKITRLFINQQIDQKSHVG